MAREQVKRKAAAAAVEIGRGVLVRGGARVENDPWVVLADGEPAPQNGDVIVPLARFKAEREVLFARRGKLGVLLTPTDAVEELGNDAQRLALIMVQFPAFRDGRGFTTARLLRERYRFTGELRAAGEVLEDQLYYMLRCGFSSFEIIAADPEAAFARAAATFTNAYQNAADGLAPAHVLRARRRGELIDFPVERAAQLSRQVDGKSARDILQLAAHQLWPGRFAVVSSFGAESAVLLHIVASIDLNIPVIFLETDRHFAQTLQYRDELIAKLGLTNVQSRTPDAAEAAREDAKGDLWKRDNDACCTLRKVRPLARALNGVEAWATGRKRFQGGLRQTLQPFEHDGARYKVNPLYDWTAEDIEAYMVKHDLPRHPLVEQGFASIGCWPCTKAAEGREGRWADVDDKTECGIHLPHEMAEAEMVSGR